MSIAHDVNKMPGGFHVTCPSLLILNGMDVSSIADKSFTLGKNFVSNFFTILSFQM